VSAHLPRWPGSVRARFIGLVLTITTLALLLAGVALLSYELARRQPTWSAPLFSSAQMLAVLIAVIVVSVFSLLLALRLSLGLQRAVSEPLLAITRAARRIVVRRDYSVRVAAVSDGEMDLVITAFNRMLDEVQERTRALEQSNLSLMTQIAERYATQTALARANTRLESTMAAAEIGGWITDLASGEFTPDRNFAALYGHPDDEMLRLDPQRRYRQIHDQDRARFQAAEADALRSGSLTSVEFRIVQPDGGVRWVIARGKVQFDADAQPQLLAGLLIDITAQKQAEQQRRDSESVYRAIGESIDYGVWITDDSGRCTYASDSFLALTGLSQAQCTEFGWSSALHPDDAEATIAAWKDCVRTGNAWYREHRIVGADGHYHAVLAQGVPMRRDDGRIYGWAGINLDISRLKRTEEALLEADRRKDEFLATLAHELRNPLAPIRHATQLLDAPGTTDEQRQWGREVIARQVQHMALLLDDLLDVSRITRRRLALKSDDVSLKAIIDAAVETARPLIEARSHQLHLQLPALPVVLHADPLRLSQALSNLLTNAAKYTDVGGRITLAADVGANGLRVRVTDNGIGLSAEAIPRVFEMFSQIDSALERSQGGLGIGLALVRGLVELHGGTIDVGSPGLGQGTTFTIRLPRRLLRDGGVTAVAATPGVAAAQTMRQMLLVADDNRDAADSLAMLLRLQGYQVSVAYSGPAALAQALDLQPAAMVLDIGMPGMTGYELAQQIRQQPWGRDALLIALTGWGQKEDVDRALQIGFDHHFVKPVDFPKLQQQLQQGLLQRQPG